MMPGHEIIRASAGSGKTWQLTLRFIRLLALGVPPDHIVALTFTRKAAGEFFARILTRLAGAAGSEELACELSASLAVRPLASADFRRLLREVVAGMHRLRLGTLDGFFAQILRAFPYEFGLAGDFTVPSAELAVLDRQRVFGRLFEPGEAPTAAQREFLEAFKQATWGQEDFRLADLLDRFIRERHDWLLAAPFERQWGGAALIWGEKGAPQPLSTEALLAAIETVRGAVEALDLTPRQDARWTEWFAALSRVSAGNAFEKPFKYFSEHLAEWRHADVVAVDRVRVPFSPAQRRAFLSLVSHPVALDIAAALERTRGVWRILSQYEAAYHQLVRRAGRLSFADVQALLAGATPAQRSAGEEPPLERLDFAARLDGRFDHWLLDEFQDTSLLQWSILHPLVREALMDPEGQRTYFHVGDEKQAIYAWREGEARLTARIVDHYGPALTLTTLAQSYRSAPAVLEAVNRVCGAHGVLRGMFADKAPEAIDRWQTAWANHTAGGKAAQLSGHAALVRPRPPADGEKPCFEDEMATVCALLRRMEPLRRGLTCAVLVPRNEDARQAAAFIAGSGFPAVADAKRSVATDNMPCRALMALLHATAHPGDTLAWEAARMTPLRPRLERPVHAVAGEILAQLSAEGFGATVAAWCRHIAEAVPALAPFNRLRLAQFTELAAQFDDEGGADIDEFLAYVRGAQTRGADSASRAVQCMTIHAAKGLEFDIVFLAGLDGDSFTTVDAEWLRQRDAELLPAWYLRTEKKALAESDESLATTLRAMTEEGTYESLCTAYVALTRAKRALCMVCPEPNEKTERRNAAVWLQRALADGGTATTLDGGGGGETVEAAWQTGDPEWFAGEQAPPKGAPEPESLPHFPAPAAAHARQHAAHTPSDPPEPRGTDAARARGSLVHAMLARVVDPADDSSLLAWFRDHCPAPDAGEMAALDDVRRCLASPAVRAAMGAPGDGVDVWREKAFEAMVDGSWTSGVFDRVVVGPDWARLVEYKTSALTDTAARAAASQLADYRKAVAQLTGLDETRVTAHFVFTHDATVA